MRIKKVLNSSVVLVEDDAHQESILLGKGIGFGQKPGNVIVENQKNQVFRVHGRSWSWSTAFRR